MRNLTASRDTVVTSKPFRLGVRAASNYRRSHSLEPITHFLTGACLGRAGLNRKTALATVTLTLAAEAPDIDILAYFKGSAFGFAHHRAFTHTFLGIPFMAALVVGGVWAGRWLFLKL